MKKFLRRYPHFVIMGLLIFVVFAVLLISAVFNHSKPKPLPTQLEYPVEIVDRDYPFQFASILQQQKNNEWIFSLGSIIAIDSTIENKLIVTASDNALNAWETDGTKYSLTHRCPIRNDMIICLALSRKGNALAVGTNSGMVLVWDTGSWKQRLAIKPYSARIPFLTFSPDEKILAVVCSGGLVKLLNAQTGEEIRAISVRSKTPIAKLVFSPDGKQLLISCYQSTESFLYDIKTGEKTRTLTHSEISYPLATFSPDGQTIYCAEDDFHLPPISTDFSQRVRNPDLNLPQKKAITAVDFSPDGQRLLSGCMDGTVKLWDVQTRQEILTIDKSSPRSRYQFSQRYTYPYNLNYPRMLLPSDLMHLRFFPDGDHVLIGLIDGTIEIFDLIQQKPIQTLSEHHVGIQQYAITRDWSRLLTKTLDGKIQLWDQKNHEILYSLDQFAEKFTDMMFSPDDSMFAALDETGSIQLFETDTGNLLRKISNPPNPDSGEETSPDSQISFPRNVLSEGNPYRRISFQSFSFSPDGKYIVACDPHIEWNNNRGNIKIVWFDIHSGEIMKTWKQECSPSQSDTQAPLSTLNYSKIRFTPDGTRCVIVKSDEIKVWNVQSGEEIPEITIGANGAEPTLSPDSRFIFLFSRSMELWDLQSGQYVETIFDQDPKRRYPIQCAAFSEDGNWLVCGNIVGTVYILDIHSKQILYTLKIPNVSCNYLRFSPDRSQLLIGNPTELRILDISDVGKAKE